MATNDSAFGESNPKSGTNLVVIGGWLNSVVSHGDIRRASSDISRVKVTRKTASGTVQQWVINENKSLGINDLWLLDGDQIEIPERDINRPNTNAPVAVSEPSKSMPPPAASSTSLKPATRVTNAPTIRR
jgi:hypothetical protein